MKIETAEVDNQAPQAKLASRWQKCWRSIWFRCLVLAIIGFAVHAPALQGDLIWDDAFLARDNPMMKSPAFALEVFRHHLFIESYSPHYRPVQNLSYMFDYAFWNTNTFGFHLTNVLLHVGSGIVLYLLLLQLLPGLTAAAATSRFTAKRYCSFVALAVAAVWVVHPAHSAAVDYISGRADSLAFLFSASAWVLVLRARSSNHRAIKATLFMAAACCALLGLCSRESALLWVALFILHIVCFDRERGARHNTALIIGALAVVGVYFGLRQLPPPRAMPTPSAGWPLAVRAVLILRALGDYGRVLMFPTNLHMERTVFYAPAALEIETARRGALAFEYLAVGGAALLALVTVWSFRRGLGQHLRAFGAIWFFAAFLPISNIVDLNATVAEHWMYLPSVGLFLFFAGCAIDLPGNWARLSGTATAVIVVALGVRAFNRSSDWVDAKTFYQRTAAAGGTSCRVTLNLGLIYCTEHNYAESERLLRNVLKIQPDYAIARNNLADVLAREGKKDEAEQLWAEATRTAAAARKDYPRTWIGVINFARALHERGDDAGACGVLDKARHDYPETWEIVSSESEVLRNQDKLDDALSLVESYAQQHWWHYHAWMALGRLRAQKGDVDLSESALRHASWLDIRSTDALNLLALIRLRQNRLDEAWRAQRRAVARQPDQPRQYVLLSNILEKMGRSEEARAAMAEVTRLRGIAANGNVAN